MLTRVSLDSKEGKDYYIASMPRSQIMGEHSRLYCFLSTGKLEKWSGTRSSEIIDNQENEMG